VVRRRGEDVADHVFFLEVRPADPLAAATLTLEVLDRLTLDVAGARHGDDDVLLGDQVLEVELALVGPERGSSRVRVLLPDLEQLLLDDPSDLPGVLEERLEVLDPREQVLVLLLELRASELGEAAQRHVQDVVGLDLRELELAHQLGARVLGVRGATDDADDLVEVLQRDQQALDDVVALLGSAELVLRPAGHDVDLVVDVVADELGEVQHARHVVDEREHDDAEVLLQLRVLVELVEHDLRVRAPLEVDDQAHALAVGLVLQVRDVLQPPRADELGDLLREPRLVDLVRQLRHDHALAPLAGLLDARDGADLDGAAPGQVRVLDALLAEDVGARGEVRALDELHQVLRRRIRVVEEVHGRVDDLAEVVRRDVRRHPDGDAVATVDQQIREPAGEHERLLLVPVVVRDEVDRFRVDVAEHLHRHL
jgi:hypothetical protein